MANGREAPRLDKGADLKPSESRSRAMRRRPIRRNRICSFTGNGLIMLFDNGFHASIILPYRSLSDGSRKHLADFGVLEFSR